MTAEVSRRDEPVPVPKRIHFGWLLLGSFLLWNGAYVIDQAVRWTNHFEGFINGVFHMYFTGLVWALYLGPWSLIVWALYRWQGWHRFRALWVLGPAVLVFVVQIGALLVSPPTPEARFKRAAGVALPEQVADLRVHFTGGGTTDLGDTYYFTCAPEVTDGLIEAMKLEEDPSFGNKELGIEPYSIVPLRDGWPDYWEWEGLRQFGRGDGAWFYFLLTDEARTRVYVYMGSI
jgi:hypothetical protein